MWPNYPGAKYVVPRDGFKVQKEKRKLYSHHAFTFSVKSQLNVVISRRLVLQRTTKKCIPKFIFSRYKASVLFVKFIFF